MKGTAKQEAQRVLDTLPEDAPLEQIQYRLYVFKKIEAGLEDVRQGRVLDQREVELRMAKWLEP